MKACDDEGSTCDKFGIYVSSEHSEGQFFYLLGSLRSVVDQAC